MGSRLSARRALISLVLVGALSGCGDDADVVATTTPEPTVTSAAPEPSPTPTPLPTSVSLPVMPPEMANNDAAGAEAAARYFVDLYGYTYLSRDLSFFEKMSDDDCVFCNSVILEVNQMISDGETQAGGLVFVDAIIANEYHQTVDAHILELQTTQNSYVEIDKNSEVIAENSGGSLSISILVQMMPDGWIVLEAGSDERE
ncbi:MAG: DUF6318 family protein [Actinomycetota bacterium]